MESKRWFYVGLAILTLLVVAALLAPLRPMIQRDKTSIMIYAVIRWKTRWGLTSWAGTS